MNQEQFHTPPVNERNRDVATVGEAFALWVHSSHMGELIDDFLSATIPPEVWHYTDPRGFEGIISSGRVWATEAHHTTDKTEFVNARDVARRCLERLEPKDDGMVMAKRTALEVQSHAFDEGVLSSSLAEIFVASFCEVEDLKSQWMEYADAGRGVALSFDLRHIRPPVEIGCSVTFAPCLYATDEKERLVEDALSDWLHTVQSLHKKTGSLQWAAERLHEWLSLHPLRPLDKAALLESNTEEFRRELHQSVTLTSFNLLRIASHCKDHAFHQESEWRLALPHLKKQPMKSVEILHRGTNGTIPYIAHNLFSDRLPLVRIKVGPICEEMDRIKGILKQSGYDVRVERSTVPIRTAASIQQ
jgi:hypothetical protein